MEQHSREGGRIAVVIGAGTIGSAIARHLEARGWTAYLVGHEMIELTDPASIARYFERWQGFDLLVNAAGSYGAIGKVADVAPEAWRTALDINLVGVYACCHHALARLSLGGHIVNIAGGGRGPMEMRAGYAAAKSGLWRLTQTLSAEEPALHVNAIAPGPMDSRMQDAVVGVPAEWANFMRAMRAGQGGAVPVENTLRALDHLLAYGCTGQLLFARNFGEPLAVPAAHLEEVAQ